MYLPQILSSKKIREHELGRKHSAVLHSDIVSDEEDGPNVDYNFLFVVLDNNTKDVEAIVASEVHNPKKAAEILIDLGLEDVMEENDEDQVISHMLCAFTPSGHLNYGSSNDWLDIDKFEKAAIELVKGFDFISLE